jgi:hypothetical protein
MAVLMKGQARVWQRARPAGWCGKFVATGAAAALPALDGLDVTVLADIWIGTFGAGWPCVCHETPLSWSSTNGHKVKQPEQIFHNHWD